MPGTYQGPKRIAIVGGGITGLAAAHSIMQANRHLACGAECTVIEGSARWGGKIQTEQADGFLVEQGAESMLARKVEARDFCAELGLSADLVGNNQHGAGTFVVHQGKLTPLPESMLLVAPTRFRPWVQTPLLSLAGKLRAGLDLVLPSRKGDDDESLIGLVRRRFGNEVADRLAEPLLASIYGGGSDLSVLATFPELRELEKEHRSLLLGLRATAARRNSAARPGSSTAGGSTGGSIFVAPRHGMHSIISRTVDALAGTRMLLDTPVESLTVNAGQNGRGRYELSLANGGSLEADGVILTTPASVTQRLVEDVAPLAAQALSGISAGDTIVVVVAYPRQQIQHAPEGTGFLVPQSEQRMIIGCTWLSQKWPHTSDPDHVLLRCYVGGRDAPSLMDLPDSKLESLVHQELSGIMGVEGAPVFGRVYRWRNAIPHYSVGHLDRVARADAAIAELPSFAIAGASYRGLGVPDCIRQGQTAAARLLGLEQPFPWHGMPATPETEFQTSMNVDPQAQGRPLSQIGA